MAMVQSQHNSLNISISKVSNISTLGKVLTDQAVGIFIGSVLLSGLWRSKMYIGFQFFDQGSVFGKFLAIATGEVKVTIAFCLPLLMIVSVSQSPSLSC